MNGKDASMTLSTGYGTYITAGLLLAATIGHQAGWIDDATFKSIMGVLGAGGMTFLRAAVAKADSANASGNALLAQKMGIDPQTITAVIKPPPAGPPASLV
jgi:hypothetical protein